MRTLKALLLAAACLVAAQLVASEQLKFREASLPCPLLSNYVKPTEYKIHLNFSSLDSELYEGCVDIDFLISRPNVFAGWRREDASCEEQYDENMIVLHAYKNLEIQHIKMTIKPYLSPIYIDKKIKEVVRDEATQMIGIKLKHGIYAPGKGKISITFKGQMLTLKHGPFLGTNNERQVISDKMVPRYQSSEARFLFPSFDEWRFRVPLSLRLTYPKGLTAYSNEEVKEASEEGDLMSNLFVTTPRMPLLALDFTIGESKKLLSRLSTPWRSYEDICLVSALALSKDKEVLAALKSWLENSGLQVETMKPFLDTISAALSQ